MRHQKLSGLKRDEMCQALGISVSTLRRRVKAGQVRCALISGEYRYFLDTDIPMSLTPPDTADTEPVSDQYHNVKPLRRPQNSSSAGTGTGTSVALKVQPVTQPIDIALAQIAELTNKLLLQQQKNAHIMIENAELFALLDQVAQREETRRSKIANLNDTSKWKWRKRSRMRQLIIDEFA